MRCGNDGTSGRQRGHMASKAEKLRRKRGRPLKEGVGRTDSGRISRATGEQDPVDKVAKEARMKMYGIAKDVAGSPEAATVVGRLYLLGQRGGGISLEQYNGLCQYRDGREQYLKAIQAPDSLASKSSSGPTRSEDEDAEARAKAKARYMSARRAIQDCQNENPGRNMWAAVDYLVIKDLDFSYMIGDLRLVGNALARHYGFDRVSKIAS